MDAGFDVFTLQVTGYNWPMKARFQEIDQIGIVEQIIDYVHIWILKTKNVLSRIEVRENEHNA